MAERKRNAPMNYTPGRATTAAASAASPAASGIDAADRASRRACVQRQRFERQWLQHHAQRWRLALDEEESGVEDPESIEKCSSQFADHSASIQAMYY